MLHCSWVEKGPSLRQLTTTSQYPHPPDTGRELMNYYSHSSPEKYTMACTVVLRKSTHGRITLQLRQRGGWALFSVLPLLTTKEHPCNDYSDSMPSKQLIGQTVCTTEPPVTLKSRSDGTQHSERHKASTNVLRKKFARFNFTLRASYEILTRCVLLNQHVVD